jgi:hypothetical protein
MAWGKRRGGERRYYYRHRRINSRSKKIYLGAGSHAQEAAQKDAETAAARSADRAAADALEQRLEPLDHLGDELDKRLEMFVEAALLTSGYHEHRGRWRRRHGSQPTHQAL